jgi:acylglycerol lipase
MGPHRLAELLRALSLATDLGIGAPLETALRTCVLARELGAALGFDDSTLRSAYFAGLLRHIGCTSWAHEAAALSGDDHDLVSAFEGADPSRTGDIMARALKALGRDQPVLGLADHSSRYASLAKELVEAGFAVWAFDMRGHGRSAGHRASIQRADQLLGDLDAMLAQVRAEEPDTPVFLYGHSLGGMVAALYAIERQPPLAGVVLIAPALAFDGPPLEAALVRFLTALAPNTPALATPHGEFSQRPEVVDEMGADPLIYQPDAPIRTARTALEGTARIWAAPENLRAPLLVVHGSVDALTAPAGSRDLVARAGTDDATFRFHEGLMHDPLREPEGAGERVRGEIVSWLVARSGGPADALESSAPARRLVGDRRSGLASIDLDARGARAMGDGLGDGSLTAGVRARFGIGSATALNLGFLGGVDLRGGYLDGSVYEADAHLLGLVARTRAGALMGLTGGVGLGGPRGASATRAPVELSLEVPAGAARVLARAGLAWRLGGAAYADDAFGLADEAGALVGVRLGRDRRHWADVTAGAGPYLGVSYRNVGGAEHIGLLLGVNLWGAN